MGTLLDDVNRDIGSGNATAIRAQSARFLAAPIGRSLMGLALLLFGGGLIEPRTVAPTVFLAMLPFAAILGIATIGQHLVIQQRGFDLSVAGTMSASAVLVTNLAGSEPSLFAIVPSVLVTLAFEAAAGMLNGIFVNRLSVTPLVTTIGTNALFLGVAYWYSNGVPVSAQPYLVSMAAWRTLGVPNLLLVTLTIFAATVYVLQRMRVGRSFVAVGVNPQAARALAISVDRYQIGTYAVAGLFFATAAIFLSGVLATPTLLSGAPYMLTTVAAVVVGGSPLNGERSSMLSTLVGALFLTYLNQLVVSLGFDQSVQNISQAAIILVGVAVPTLFREFTR